MAFRPYHVHASTDNKWTRARDVLMRQAVGAITFVLTFIAIRTSMVQVPSSPGPPPAHSYHHGFGTDVPLTLPSRKIQNVNEYKESPKPKPIANKVEQKDKSIATGTNVAAAASAAVATQPPKTTTAEQITPQQQIPVLPQKEEEEKRFAVFYNIYQPPNAGTTQSKILKEQFKMIRKSDWRRDPIYFHLIGPHTNIANQTDLCPATLDCQQLGHHRKGWEEITLTSLWGFCRRNPNATVAYIHNKGSWNNKKSNHKIRRMATKAVLSAPCRSISPLNATRAPFNVCGLHFYVSPYFHYNGNMFAASCQYVQHLVPPKAYPGLRESFCQTLVRVYQDQPCNATNHQNTPLTANQKKSLGYGRYAMERWLFSHPLVRPANALGRPVRQFQNGLEPWEPVLAQPGLPALTNDVRQRIEAQLQQFHFLHNDVAPDGGFCQAFTMARKSVCNGMGGYEFASVYNETVVPLLANV